MKRTKNLLSLQEDELWTGKQKAIANILLNVNRSSKHQKESLCKIKY